MLTLSIMVLSSIGLLLGYLFYGTFIARHLRINPQASTPSTTHYDGVDYVPAKSTVLLGHHFASIAGAGPIVGPILAAQYGWLPCLLWILFGGIFFGAVHDFVSLVASVRHEGKSIGWVIESYVGKRGKFLFLTFTWATLVLVIAVFCLIVARAFAHDAPVATASILFILLAIFFGIANRSGKISLLVLTVIALILMGSFIALSYQLPMVFSQSFWIYGLLIYVFIASVLPVWLLLQPRDYLSAFLLYAILIGGVIGVIFLRPSLTFQTYLGFTNPLGPLFPMLFVTIACGAVSGFHSLVASGTTAKQLASEADAKMIGYGGMLIESLLAVLALMTAITLPFSDYSRILHGEGGPIAIFSHGMGRFLAIFGIPQVAATILGALAISAFALTSLDTCTRLARYILQEFFEGMPQPFGLISQNRYLATLFTVMAGGLLAFSGKTMTLWPLFGSANQLLAGLALLACTVWLIRKKSPAGFVLAPMVFMYGVTLSALGVFIHNQFQQSHWTLAGIAMALFILAIFLGLEALFSIARGEERGAEPSHA